MDVVSRIALTSFFGMIAMLMLPSLVVADDGEQGGWSGSLSYTGDLLANTRGGIDEGHEYVGLATIELDYANSDWSGHSNVYIPHGDSVSEGYVGDFAVVSNIDMPGPWRLQELWLQRKIGIASVRFGMLAADTEFWGSGYGGLFVSSAFGAPSIVSANLPGSSIFPVATLGVRVDWQLDAERTLRIAVLDGNAGDPEGDNPHGLDITLDEGALLLGEFEWHPADKGTLRLSGFYHSGPFVTDTGTEEDGSWGALVVLDYPVTENIGWFGRIGFAADDRSLSPWSFETGINVGNVFGSPATLGLAYANVHLDNAMFRLGDPLSDVSHESIVELTIDYPVNDFFTFQPDLQYIFNPGGDASQDSALVAGVRIKLNMGF